MRVEPRPTPAVRCAYCHGSLGPVFSRCPVCTTPLHLDCFARLPGCPILGCAGKLGGAPRPRRPLLAQTWWIPFLLVVGSGLGLVARLVTAERERAPTPRPSLEVEPYSIPYVLESTRSPDDAVRLGAVMAVTRYGGEQAVAALIERLQRDTVPRIRQEAAKDLAIVRALPEVQPSLAALSAALRDDDSGQVRATCASSLTLIAARAPSDQLGGVRRRAVAALASALDQDPEARVRVAAAEGLGVFLNTIAGARARAALEAHADDRSWLVRQAVARALDGSRRDPERRPR